MHVAVDANAAADMLIQTWRHLVTGIPDGWSRYDGKSLGAVTRVAVPALNGVWSGGVEADVEVTSALLDEIAATGMPHCLQVRPGVTADFVDLADARGMTREDDIPLMVLEDLGGRGNQVDQSGLVIRELRPEDAPLHARVVASGFDAPAEPFLQLMTPRVLSLHGVRCYLGEVDRQPVTTALGVSLGSSVGLFNIATLPTQRRHGFGAAITARAVFDGFAAGCTWSWLQSSNLGYGVYEHLGFRTLERWSCWVAVGSS